MKRLVKIKNSNITLYVKLSTSYEFGIPTGHWIGVDEGKIYHSNELIFLQD